MSISAQMKEVYSVLEKDPVMKDLLQRFGELTLEVSNKFFDDIISAIIGQLLSGKAAETIYKRVVAVCECGTNAQAGRTIKSNEALAENINGVTPEGIIEASEESLRAAGCSYSKIRCMKAFAQAVINKEIDLKNIIRYDDEEIIAQLSAIKGIGRWTAEMFLIFSLAKEDIFSFLDGGLKNAVNKLYGGGEVLSKNEVSEITKAWAPYRSYASLYLWKSLQNR